MDTLRKIDHLAIRLPNWLGDICMAMPIIRALQTKAKTENPSLKITLFMLSPYVELMQTLDIDADYVALPAKNLAYFPKCLSWRGQFDAHLLFTNSERGDLEAWLMGSNQRFGLAKVPKKRRLLTHRYMLDPTFNPETTHQTSLWADFATHFGLIDTPDMTPIANSNTNTEKRIALICGSSNTPEKRWDVENWQVLVNHLLTKYDHITLLGTDEDRPICDQVQSAVANSEYGNKVVNLAGKTQLPELTDIMRQQQLVIGNDTGGLHLANMLGVSVIGLFGPTNPIRTKPIHDAPVGIIQSPQEYTSGKMSDISVDDVLNKLYHQTTS